MEVQHFSHHHPLVFIQDHSVASKPGLCLGCEKPVEGWSYGCNQCEFYLHKGCAELELGPQIQHPFHPEHPLTLLPQSPYGGANWKSSLIAPVVKNQYLVHFTTVQIAMC
ncbi:hypothetical protein GOBAR_AA24364 [Gossypium barbadense]|uniref:DC1 domain-containing protein n=1 Tax=Gossypium barbadense TaxID=3634 RepID=A0A2P5WZ27_GOSBA|nr:hypothetical protein GOBAR_AA24364 [Gossypium barbadense]